PASQRSFAALGAGYCFQSLPELSIDAAYSRHFFKEVPLKTVNQDRLGGDRLDGRPSSKRLVFSLSATYDFYTRP
ncbi:outer membrane protein transport protein, partial [Pseudomonas aeruginosa]